MSASRPPPPLLLGAVDRAAFVVAFSARLQRAGVSVGFTGMGALVRAMAATTLDSRSSLYWATRYLPGATAKRSRLVRRDLRRDFSRESGHRLACPLPTSPRRGEPGHAGVHRWRTFRHRRRRRPTLGHASPCDVDDRGRDGWIRVPREAAEHARRPGGHPVRRARHGTVGAPQRVAPGGTDELADPANTATVRSPSRTPRRPASHLGVCPPDGLGTKLTLCEHGPCTSTVAW